MTNNNCVTYVRINENRTKSTITFTNSLFTISKWFKIKDNINSIVCLKISQKKKTFLIR